MRYLSVRPVLAISVAVVLTAWAQFALSQPSGIAQQRGGSAGQGSALARRGDGMIQQRSGMVMAESEAVTFPQVVLFEPNGGEIFRAGARDTVRWSIADSIDVDSVNIHYSIDGGATFPFKVASLGPGDSTYVWLIPNTPSTICKIKVVAFDSAGNQISAMSDSTFAIARKAKRRVPPFSYFGS